MINSAWGANLAYCSKFVSQNATEPLLYRLSTANSMGKIRVSVSVAQVRPIYRI